jgi:DNA-binding phage protein
MRIIERKDIVRRLSIEVQKAGGQTAWANKNGLNRTHLNKVLHGVKPPSEKIIRAIGLRTVVISD